MSCRTAVWALLALSFCLPAWAQVYQWRDAEGKLHFTDTPPPQSLKVEAQHLQVKPALGQAEPEQGGERAAAGDAELKPAQLQQKAALQCSESIARMPSLINETQKLGREAVRQSKTSQRQLDEAMIQMDDAYLQLKRNERDCISAYLAGGESRRGADCMADTQDVLGFGQCMQFAGWANVFGK